MSMTARRMLALVLSMCMALQFCMLPGGAAYAEQSDSAEYEFDDSRTATEQLESMFTTIDIMDATIGDLTREMEAGNVTSEQLTQMYIDRINAYDRKLKLNSIISICPEALDQARALDRERAEGNIRGPLHGIPIIVKDNIDVAGTATSGGSLALAHMVISTDSFVVKKLKDAGAVIVAKANLSEFASSAIDSRSLLGGDVHNAYDISRVPAGSSGGTGVAITSNFAAAGLGTDTGGSVRNPSSYSNLYGIRPTKGLTSISGVIPLCTPRDTVGPMARTAEDMAQVLEVIAGTDENDDFTQEAKADELLGAGYMSSLSGDGLKGKRIGYLQSSFQYEVPEATPADDTEDPEAGQDQGGTGTSTKEVKVPDAKIDAMVKRTRADLRRAGAEFVDMSSYLSDKELLKMCYSDRDETTEYDFNRYLHQKGDEAPYKTLKALYKSGKVGIYHTNLSVWPGTEDSLADSFEETENPYTENVNGYMRGKSWQTILNCREKVMSIMEEHDIDAIMYIASLDVAPTCANMINQFKINDSGWEYGFAFGPVFGMPEVVIPMGFSETDDKVSVELPLGMRLAGKYGDEKTLMEMAYAYEQQAGDSIRRMPANSPALEDQNLAAYLEALMDKAYSIDYDLYKSKPVGKVEIMLETCDKADDVDTSDPYETYKAAGKLARAYDRVMKALKESGLKKLKTTFQVKASPKKVKAGAKKSQTVKVKVSKLTKGSSKPVYTIRRVTKGQKSKVKINKSTGKVTIKKKTKKCKITIQVSSKANDKYSGLTKSVTITVK